MTPDIREGEEREFTIRVCRTCGDEWGDCDCPGKFDEVPFVPKSRLTAVEQERDRLAEALDRLEGGPDTLTPDGAKVLHDYGELRARLALSQHSDPEGGTDG